MGVPTGNYRAHFLLKLQKVHLSRVGVQYATGILSGARPLVPASAAPHVSLPTCPIPPNHFSQNKNTGINPVFLFSERVGGIEPPSSAWKADIKTIIRYPLNLYNNNQCFLSSQLPPPIWYPLFLLGNKGQNT